MATEARSWILVGKAATEWQLFFFYSFIVPVKSEPSPFKSLLPLHANMLTVCLPVFFPTPCVPVVFRSSQQNKREPPLGTL